MELETFRSKIVRKKHRDRPERSDRQREGKRERERERESSFDTLILTALTMSVVPKLTIIQFERDGRSRGSDEDCLDLILINCRNPN